MSKAKKAPTKLRRSPSALTLAYLRELGWLAESVEKDVPHARTKRDLFGWIDVLALKDGQVCAIQCTSRSNMAARMKKVLSSSSLNIVLETDWRLDLVGWSRQKESSPAVAVFDGHEFKVVDIREVADGRA